MRNKHTFLSIQVVRLFTDAFSLVSGHTSCLIVSRLFTKRYLGSFVLFMPEEVVRLCLLLCVCTCTCTCMCGVCMEHIPHRVACDCIALHADMRTAFTYLSCLFHFMLINADTPPPALLCDTVLKDQPPLLVIWKST